jgi:hypothetical protein
MGRILAPTQDLKINLPGDITIPTLISPAGNSEDYVFLPNEDIYLETEVYLNSYNTLSPILGVQSTEYNIVNEYAFFISDINETGGRGIPQGAVVVYNGERGVSLSCYYTYQNIVNLNQWTKIVAKRVNSNWSIFINDVQCAVSRVTDSNVPNDIFGNINLPVHIGRLEVDDVNLDGQIRNVILNNKPKKNNKVSIKKQNLGGGKLYTNKSPIIEDILQTQTSTIGQLHYNILRRDGEENKPIRTVFGNSSGGPNGSTSDKVVRNEIQQSWNRINYNMNAINMSTQLSNFTVIFDARVNGTADGYGFYWYAKGTYNVNTPQNYAVCTNYPCEEGACLDSRCEDYNECYEFDQDGYCINYDECYSFACLDFDCWTYDYTNCQGTVLYSNWDSFPDRGSNYGNRPDNDSYVVFFDYYNNRIRAWWGASDPRSSIFGSNLGEAVSISAVLQNPGNLRDGKWRKHKIQYSGNVIKVFIDDKLHLTVTDTTPWDRNKTGRNFGLYGGVGGASAFNEFRNFKFYDYIR